MKRVEKCFLSNSCFGCKCFGIKDTLLILSTICFISELGMDWNLKGTTPGLTSNMSSVMTTSVLSGAHMTSSLSANGEERVVDLENHDPSRGLDDLSEHNFSPGLQVCE